MAYCAPKQLSSTLPQVVPALTEVLTHSHPRVKDSANAALALLARSSRIQRSPPSCRPFYTLSEPSSHTQDALDALAKTQFEHYVDTPSLALIVPVLPGCAIKHPPPNGRLPILRAICARPPSGATSFLTCLSCCPSCRQCCTIRSQRCAPLEQRPSVGCAPASARSTSLRSCPGCSPRLRGKDRQLNAQAPRRVSQRYSPPWATRRSLRCFRLLSRAANRRPLVVVRVSPCCGHICRPSLAGVLSPLLRKSYRSYFRPWRRSGTRARVLLPRGACDHPRVSRGGVAAAASTAAERPRRRQLPHPPIIGRAARHPGSQAHGRRTLGGRRTRRSTSYGLATRRSTRRPAACASRVGVHRAARRSARGAVRGERCLEVAHLERAKNIARHPPRCHRSAHRWTLLLL